MAVGPYGDVFVALGAGVVDQEGGLIVLHDGDHNGVADTSVFLPGGVNNAVIVRQDLVYVVSNDAVIRYAWPAGQLAPSGDPDTIVRDLPTGREHRAKAAVFDSAGELLVSVGAPLDNCEVESTYPEPCPLLTHYAGVWRFDAGALGQTLADATHFATGLRHTLAMAVRPSDGVLYGVVHGRQGLEQWFGRRYGAANPAEELVRIQAGRDYGWPYCYYSMSTQRRVLAPEYGGDGVVQGGCIDLRPPLLAFPAHWAPDGMLFYHGTQFPAQYRGGAFVAFHGSMYRSPLPEGGFNVVFAPFDASGPTGSWVVFADGFAGSEVDAELAYHRPVGLAEGPDGSLYISDDQGGRIYRVHVGGVK
jgi:glucose/arabinose dehydrogenase